MKNREQIITDMCRTWRHDYGLDKDPGAHGFITLGMTEHERKVLWNAMAQVFDNCIVAHLTLEIPDSRPLCDND
jgi:hypothetical protein